jgi:hypothetical protein
MASWSIPPMGKIVVSQLAKKVSALLLNPKFLRLVHSISRPVVVLSQSNPIKDPPI